MKNKKPLYLIAVGALAAALIGASASIALAAGEPVDTVGSSGDYFLVDSNTGTTAPAGTTIPWNSDYSGSPIAAGGFSAFFTGPADAVTVRTFISARGSERTPSAWLAYADSAFIPGTQNVLMPSAQLSAQILGNALGVKSAGGNYSLGFAFMKGNNVQIASGAAYYDYITVTAGTGAWKFATPVAATPVTPPSGAFTENLEVTTIQATDGALNLVAPANATAIIGNPTLVNNLSTSTGTLGQFSVQDARVVNHPGWTLTTTVSTFTKQGDTSTTIPNSQLGVKPVLVSTTAAGVVTSPETIAGSAVYGAPFAQADNSAQVGDSNFNADLKFIAPANKPAGVYTSTLTLSLVSK